MLTFRNIFDAYDKGHTGYISNVEFRDILNALGLPLDLAAVARIWYQVDLNHDDRLSYDAFARVVMPLTARFSEMLAAFRAYDTDKDGNITVNEARSVMEQFGMRLSVDEVARIMDKDDIASLQGQVDYKLFLKGATTFYKETFLKIMLVSLDDNDNGDTNEKPQSNSPQCRSPSYSRSSRSRGSGSRRSGSRNSTVNGVIIVTEYENEEQDDDEEDELIERRVSMEIVQSQSIEMVPQFDVKHVSDSYMIKLEDDMKKGHSSSEGRPTKRNKRSSKGIKVRQMSDDDLEIEENEVKKGCCSCCCWWRKKKGKEVKPKRRKKRWVTERYE